MVLSKYSPPLAHMWQNTSLILLSLYFLHIDTLILLISLILRPWLSPNHSREKIQAIRASPTFHRRAILVTGVGMSKGLCLARHFHTAGHHVIGADFSTFSCGSVSRALNAFYPLLKPDEASQASADQYIKDLLRIIKKEKIDLWVSCSGVASAVQDGLAKEIIEAETSCIAIQYNVKTTETLHEKHTFIAHAQSLGLAVPETYVITSKQEAREILSRSAQTSDSEKKREKRRYILKTIAVDDSNRGDMTLLPLPSQLENDRALSRVTASPSNPWIVQQYISGREYCTHALVVRGKVLVFVACPSLELLMHYEALPAEAPLSRAMLAFTKRFAEDGGDEFTGHLSFDFLVERSDEGKVSAGEIRLWPIECNPRAHTAVVLFNGTEEMVGAYLSALDGKSVDGELLNIPKIITPRTPTLKYYWIGHDLVTLVISPVLSVINGTLSGSDYVDSLREFRDYMVEWKDGTFEVWDPLPWWWMYHVYWPMQFWSALKKGRGAWWSRINVSTTKIFGV